MKRVQKADKAYLLSPGWNLMKDEHTGGLMCEGRIKGYRPPFLSGGPLAEKLIVHTHTIKSWILAPQTQWRV